MGKNVVLNGTLTLPTVFGGDLYIAGNWNRSATGVFTPNDRAVFFNGTTASTITANGGQLFPYLYLTKNVLATTLTLLDDIYISKEFSVTSGTFDLAAKNATLKSDATGTADFGKVGATGDVTYSGVGRFIVERYIPTGTLGGPTCKIMAITGCALIMVVKPSMQAGRKDTCIANRWNRPGSAPLLQAMLPEQVLISSVEPLRHP